MKYLDINNIFSGMERIVVGTHMSPDPDAIGSSVGAAWLLRQLGFEADICLGEDLSNSLSNLIPHGFVSKECKPSLAFWILDTATKNRFGGKRDLLRDAEIILNLDHHASNDNWGTENFVHASAAATACLVVELIMKADLSPPKDVANALYAGILDDTGCFGYGNTNSQALKIAAWLVDHGARPDVVSRDLYNNREFKEIAFRTAVVSKLKISLSDKFASLVIDKKLMEEFDIEGESSRGLVDIARSVKGVRVAALLREEEDAYWKISLRAKDITMDVSEIASYFGGGGHSQAAGCNISAQNAEEAISCLEKVIEKYL